MSDLDDDEDEDEVGAGRRRGNDDEGPDEGWTHDPVMLDEVCAYFLQESAVRPVVLYDLTLGLGGHTAGILAKEPGARAYCLDADPLAVERSAPKLAQFKDRVTLHHASLREVRRVATEQGWPRPTAVLMDFGLSSPQVDEAARGFSYRHDGPLDMRFDPTQGMTAADLLHSLPTVELARLLELHGDEPLAYEIAKKIKRHLPVTTTKQLAGLVLEAYGKTPSRVHPARRTFQALRILVNDEITAVEEAVEAAIDLLVPGGRLVTLTYHSGEDRPVKQLMRIAARANKAKLLTRRPGRPTETEAFYNPRARSAKLRAVERLADPGV